MQWHLLRRLLAAHVSQALKRVWHTVHAGAWSCCHVVHTRGLRLLLRNLLCLLGAGPDLHGSGSCSGSRSACRLVGVPGSLLKAPCLGFHLRLGLQALALSAPACCWPQTP